MQAVRVEGRGYALSSARPGFARDSWLRRLGIIDPRPWSSELEHQGAPIRCDALGCLYQLRGRTIAFAKDPRALVEDCEVADIVVSSVPVRVDCTAPSLVIDRFDLWRKGSHAIYLGDRYPRVATVQQSRGDRPWSR